MDDTNNNDDGDGNGNSDVVVCEGSGGGGVKRAAGEMEDAVGGEVKRRRKEEEVERGSDGEMKRVAEIVLVLAAMGRMRGGREPTVAEKKMMAEARAKVVAMCEELAPKDIVNVDALGGVIDDLGLNRFKDRVGFRTAPKQSISEKIAFSKRRMEESKAFASQPASCSSQRVQTSSGAINESRAVPSTVRAFSSDKPTHVPAATGTFQPPTSAVNVSSATSTPMRFHPPGTEVRPLVASPVLQNNVGKDANSVVPPRHDRAHIRAGGRLNGASPNVPVTSGVHQHTMRTTPVHLQHQRLPQVNVGTKSSVPDQLSRIDGNICSTAPQMISQAVGQMPGPVVNQTALGPQPTMHHPVHNVQFAHAPQAANHHYEISKLVQRLLAPKIPPRPVWTPPSKDYMNRAIICQFCKLAINEVENMVVCDACEKGFHLGCLQSYNAKGLPRGEWHCPRCLSMSHGKPFPPKYGRVTRNMNAPKAPSNEIGVQLSSEKKLGTVEKVSLPNAMVKRNQGSKTHLLVNQPNATTKGIQDSSLQTQTVKVVEPSSESILRHGTDIARSDISTSVKEVKPKLENCTNNTTGAAVEASLSTSTTPSASDKPPQQVKPEIPSSEDRLMSETEPRNPVTSQVNSKPDGLTTSSNQNDVDRKVLDRVENPALQHSDSNGVAESHLYNDDEKQAVRKTLVETKRAHDQAEDLCKASYSGLHNVDWVGEIDQIVDGKKFFRSCRINGMVYQVLDYALFRSGNGKLIPLKLQAMWEDSQTSSKWLAVHKCYFPDDLPEEVGRPGAPERNEVYESTHDSNVLAGFVQGPCEVLPFRKFGEETETSDQDSQATDRIQPVFVRNWFYDETRRAFCPSAS